MQDRVIPLSRATQTGRRQPRAPRGRRRLGVGATAVALAALLAGCLPPPPPPPPPPPSQDCLAQPPASAADYQALFQKRSTYWEGADATTVVERPDSSATWLFGDTFVGRVQPDGSAATSIFSHSSAMTESGPCITTHLGWLGTSLFPDPSDGTWYWPAGAIGRSDGSTDVLLTHVRATTAAPPVNFEPIGMAVAHVNPDMSVGAITAVTSNLVTAEDSAGDTEVRPYGGSVTTDGTYAYLYAFVPSSFWGAPTRADQYVARVPLAGPLTSGWEYSTCAVGVDAGLPCPVRTWSDDPSDARPMDIDPDATSATNDAPIAAFHVTRYGNGYIAVAKAADVPSTDPADNRVLAWTSSSPAGPWTSIGQIGDAPPPAADGAWTYVAQLVDTPGAGWVLTWNSNASASAVSKNIRLYGPQFATPDDLPPG